MSGSPTASMAQRIVDDEELALEDSYRLYGSMVRRYLRRFVDADEADDVLQVVFLELWRSRDRIDPSRPLEGWLFGIARKRAIDQLRRRRPGVIPMDAVRDLVGDDGDRFVDRVAWAAEIRAGLDRLPVEQQEAIELAYFGDLTQPEIASQLGIPLGTVKARMARGMRRLAAIVDGGDLL